MKTVSRFVLLIAAMFFVGLCMGAIISMLVISWNAAWGAEYTLTWQPSTTGTQPIFYEVYRGINFHAGTYDTTVAVYADSGRAYYQVRASNDYGVSEFTVPVSGRTVDVLPGYSYDTTGVYIDSDLTVVIHPHARDSILVTRSDTTDSLYWHSFFDLAPAIPDGEINLSDVAEFGQLYIASHFSMDWFMFRFGGGDVNIADLLVLGELLHGRGWKRMEYRR